MIIRKEIVESKYNVFKNGESISEHQHEDDTIIEAVNKCIEYPGDDISYKHISEIAIKIFPSVIVENEAVYFDGHKWFDMLSHIPNVTYEITGGNSLKIKLTRTSDIGLLIVDLGFFTYRQPFSTSASGVTFMIKESPKTFWVKSGDHFIHFIGDCRATSGGYNLLQVIFNEGNLTTECEIFWSRTASDVGVLQKTLDNFKAEYPMLLNWANRNPIGLSFPNQHINGQNKWLWEWTTQAEFDAGFNYHIDACIANCLDINAQGLLIWSLEGQTMPHNISYIGDPARYNQFCPELTTELVTTLFNKIRNAGLLPGVTIRAQELRPVDWSGFGWWQFDLSNVDYVNNLRNKMRWAYNNLGCRLFYIDSCFRIQPDWGGGIYAVEGMFPPFEIIRDLFLEFTDCLIIPEQITTPWVTICCPFSPGINKIDSSVKYMYPNAYQFIFGQHNQFTSQEELDTLQASLAEGNIAGINVAYSSPYLIAYKQVQGIE